MKLSGNIIFEMDEKLLLTIFITKIPIRNNSEKFSSPPPNLSHRDASLKKRYDYFWTDDFLTKKAKFVVTQKIWYNAEKK